MKVPLASRKGWQHYAVVDATADAYILLSTGRTTSTATEYSTTDEPAPMTPEMARKLIFALEEAIADAERIIL